MKQFIAGLLVASLGWGGLLYAQKAGMVDLLGTKEPEKIAEPSTDDVEQIADKDNNKKKRKKRRGKRRRRPGSQGSPMPMNQYDTTVGVVGDNLDVGSREVGMGAGAEDQLSNAEIDQGIGRVFRGIERCLLLLPPDAPATGKIVFGMHIAPSGQVTKVNLKGPKVMIQGEPGSCLRRTVKSIRYRRFDGPAMVAHYPVAFD